MSVKSIKLKPGREKSVLQKHPWIFASAIEDVTGEPASGDTVEVLDSNRMRLGWAAFSPISQIRARMWTFNVDEEINQGFFHERISTAYELRRKILRHEETNGFRLVYGEADFIPGLIADWYDGDIVVQILSAGCELNREMIFDELFQHPECKNVFERSDVDVRELEGLSLRTGLVRGPGLMPGKTIKENGLEFAVDIEKGQKTGFYLDQRQNRKRIFDYSDDKDVLNCFCYTGGFSLYALAGGARSVLSVDSSKSAIEQLKQNVELNHLPAGKSSVLEDDIFHALRLFRDQAKSFDLIILDPPKFAPTISQAEKAARAYKDINLLALKLLRSGGTLFTFSCSGGISRDLFQKIVAGAALDAKVDLRIIEQLSQGRDHPVLASFPESLYLKGLICTI